MTIVEIFLTILVCWVMVGFFLLHRSIRNIWQYLNEKSERDHEMRMLLCAEIRKELDELTKKVPK